MARITAEEKARKKQLMDEKIFSIFMEEGWASVTYDRLAKEFGVRKSSIQAYYASNIMFATALQGRIFPMVVPLLDFTSEDSFVSSWVAAYQNPNQHVFREVVKMLFENIVKENTNPLSRGAILKLQNLLAENVGDKNAESAIKSAFGETMYIKMTN